MIFHEWYRITILYSDFRFSDKAFSEHNYDNFNQ